MKSLALKLTIGGFGGGTVETPPGFNGPTTINGLVSKGLEVILLIAGMMLLIWLVIAAVQWILSSGDKEKLAKARSRMTYAIVGFIIIVLAFTITQYIQSVLNPKNVNLPTVDIP